MFNFKPLSYGQILHNANLKHPSDLVDPETAFRMMMNCGLEGSGALASDEAIDFARRQREPKMSPEVAYELGLIRIMDYEKSGNQVGTSLQREVVALLHYAASGGIADAASLFCRIENGNIDAIVPLVAEDWHNHVFFQTVDEPQPALATVLGAARVRNAAATGPSNSGN